MTDLPATLTSLAAGLVAVLAAALVAGALFLLACRLVDALAGPAVRVGFPKALLAALLVLLAQAAVGGAVVAPATRFAGVDWTTVGPGLVSATALAGLAAVAAAAVVSGLVLPARPGRAAAVGLVYAGLAWAVAGGLLTARHLAA